MKRIYEHSFDETLLNTGDWVIDVGCRGFAFSEELANMGMNVIAMDPDPSIIPPANERIHFERMALIDGDASELLYTCCSEGEANFVFDSIEEIAIPSQLIATRSIAIQDVVRVKCINLDGILSKYSIRHVGLLKLDCEGSEYSILEGIDRPIAKQISVEFHDFIGMNPDKDFYDRLFLHLGKWYNIVQHVYGPMIDNDGGVMWDRNNYWDTLLVMKAE